MQAQHAVHSLNTHIPSFNYMPRHILTDPHRASYWRAMLRGTHTRSDWDAMRISLVNM